MKRILLIVALSIGFTAMAQVTDGEKSLRAQKKDTIQGWKTGGVFGVNYTQVGLSNWAAGGQNSLAVNSILDVFANLKKGVHTWDNSLTAGFGNVKQGGGDWIKSDDQILINSKYGRKASEDWYYAALLNIKSQFAPGYNYPNDSTEILISDFMAPGYFLGAIGMDYKPTDNFTVFISPLTAKYTVVLDQDLADQGAYGVEGATYAGDNPDSTKLSDGERTRLELGGYLRLMYKTKVVENVNFETTLDLFSNYSENPGNIDVNWNNLLSMKVNKYLSATFTTSLIYDDDIDIAVTKTDGSPELDGNGMPEIGPRTQFKYVLAIGFQYRFGEKAK